jgi:hypothetical protein
MVRHPIQPTEMTSNAGWTGPDGVMRACPVKGFVGREEGAFIFSSRFLQTVLAVSCGITRAADHARLATAWACSAPGTMYRRQPCRAAWSGYWRGPAQGFTCTVLVRADSGGLPLPLVNSFTRICTQERFDFALM